MSDFTTLAWQDVVNRTFKLSVLTTTLVSLGVLTACTSTPQNKKPTTVATQQIDLLGADGLDGLEDLLYATDMRAVENDRLQILRYGDVWKRMTVGFGMDLNRFDSRIEAQRSWFISRQPYIDRLSARASRYIHYTVKEAERRGLPTELALLPIIESSYDPAATSSAAAAGLWQFIPSTGKIYGLRQSDLYDGRRDVIESTRAAYEYLSSLYNQFGSWELALASYNAGPGRIQQAINRNKAAGLPTDYWSLKLPQETMYYVPRFLAVAQIIKNPAAYGVSLPPIANRAHFREVNIPGAIDLNELSSLTGVSRGELYALNPGHRGNYTDPLAPRRILIPNDVHSSVDAKVAKMSIVAGSGGLWTGQAAPPPVLTTTTTPRVTTVTTPVVVPSTTTTTATNTNIQPSAALVTNQPSTLPNSASITTTAPTVVTASTQTTPRGSQALANFAANAAVPSAPRVPVSITPSTTTQVVVEPPITENERKALVALIEQESKTDKAKAESLIAQVVEPQPTEQEKQAIIKELEQIVPQGTEIVDPMDGAIKLTALQSSLSVADQKGEELKLGYAYPKAVAEAEKERVEAARNQGKPLIETSKEVVVIPPQGKREIYTVQAGDTLSNIASRFGLNWRDIATWNQISAESPLFVGSRLYLYNVKPIATVDQENKDTSSKPVRYTVKAGDTLTALAQQYNVSLQDLATWNNLTPTSNVLIGQNLTFIEPKNTQTPKVEPKAIAPVVNKIETESYTVKRGEYLKVIADRYGISVSELAALTTGLSVSDNLLVGQKIQVPKQQTLQSKPQTTTEVKASDEKKPTYPVMTYTVVSGDYLSTVAQRHKMTLAEIAALNDIQTNAVIMVGQKLQVQQVALQRPTNYRVQSGDTLSGVADKFGLTISQLADLNDLKNNSMLRVGTVLKLEGDVVSTTTSSASSVATRVEDAKKEEKTEVTASYKGKTESYTVKSGDNLTVLAQRYNISVADLAALNKLTARSSLRSGQKLQVPKLTTTYTVKRGDTLIGLAKRFDISTEELAKMNSINADTQVRLGQVLTVPN